MNSISSSRSGARRLPPALAVAVLALSVAVGPGCRVHSHSGPPRIVGSGLVRGHAALGIRDEDQLLRLKVSLDPGSLVDLSVWKLLRLEVGLVGASIGVGPIDLGLGALLYDPDVPRMMSARGPRDHDDDEDDAWDDDAWDHQGGDDDRDPADAPAPAAAEPADGDRWR